MIPRKQELLSRLFNATFPLITHDTPELSESEKMTFDEAAEAVGILSRMWAEAGVNMADIQVPIFKEAI